MSYIDFNFDIFPRSTQIFASHAIGGVVGNILTALFAQASVAGFDGFTKIPGGWLDHHWIQLPKHLADSAAGLGYSFVMTVSFQIYTSSFHILSSPSSDATSLLLRHTPHIH